MDAINELDYHPFIWVMESYYRIQFEANIRTSGYANTVIMLTQIYD